MADKKVSQLTEASSLASGYYLYSYNNADNNQYKVPFKIVSSFIDATTTGIVLLGKINSLSGYSNNNFALITNLQSTGSNLQNQINNIINNTGNFVSLSQTGQFYPSSNPQLYISSIPENSGLISRLSIQDYFTVYGTINFPNLGGGNYRGPLVADFEGEVTSSTDIDLDNLQLKTGGLTATLDWKNRTLSGIWYGGNLGGNWNIGGNLSLNGELIANGGIDLNGSNLMGLGRLDANNTYISGATENRHVFKFITDSQYWLLNSAGNAFIDLNGIGGFDGEFIFPISTPTISGFKIFTNSLTIGNNQPTTGYIITSTDTGQFYPRVGNPSGFVTGNIVRPSDTGNFYKWNRIADTNDFTRLNFTNTETRIYDYNSGIRFLGNNNGTYLYDQSNIIRTYFDGNGGQILDTNGTPLINFNQNGSSIIMGDPTDGIAGTKFVIDFSDSPNGKFYFTDVGQSTKVGINSSNPQYSLDISGSQNTTQTGYFGYLVITGTQSTLINAPNQQLIEYLLVSGTTRQVRFSYSSGGTQYTGAVNLI